MITPKEALELVSKAFSNRDAAAIFDYDSRVYIVAAPIKNKKDFNGCFYSVDKRSGKIETFFPGSDYDKFFDAIDNGAIEIVR